MFGRRKSTIIKHVRDWTSIVLFEKTRKIRISNPKAFEQWDGFHCFKQELPIEKKSEYASISRMATDYDKQNYKFACRSVWV